MFKRDVKSLADILQTVLRKEGFETPLLQKRLIASWDAVVGPTVARYTGCKDSQSRFTSRPQHDASEVGATAQ